MLWLWRVVPDLDNLSSTVSLGESAKLRCDAKFYSGIQHFVEWYKGRVAVYSKFTGHEPYVHPAFQVGLLYLPVSLIPEASIIYL